MIFVDGIRSLKRKWYADKLLRILEDLDLYSKVVMWDGFRFAVSAIGGLKKATITAPMGVVVFCCRDNDVVACSAEYWLSVVSTDRALFCTNLDTGVNTIFQYVLSPDSEVNVAEIAPSYSATMSNARPVLIPLGNSEYLFASVSVARAGSSVIAESVLGAFLGDNSHRTRKAFVIESDSSVLARQLVQPLPSNFFRAVRTQISTMFNEETTSIELVLGTIWTAETMDDFDRINIKSPTVWRILPEAPMPEELYYALVVPNPAKVRGQALGSYAFSPSKDGLITLISCVSTVNLSPDLSGYFYDADDNIIYANRKWRLFYSIYDGETSTLVTADKFMTVLDTLANNQILTGGTDISNPGVDVDWDMANEMLGTLFPYPNTGHVIPHDYVMFHSATHAYTWTRHYGAVKFTTDGIEVVDLKIPQVVLDNTGVRPHIFYCGSRYVCICQDTKVRGLFLGSPFDEWVAVSLPEKDLLYARIVLVSDDRVIFAGIVKYIQDEITTHKYVVYDTELGENWVEYAEIPVEYAARNNFDISFYGDGFYAECMKNVLHHPPVVPQEFRYEYSTYPIIGVP